MRLLQILLVLLITIPLDFWRSPGLTLVSATVPPSAATIPTATPKPTAIPTVNPKPTATPIPATPPPTAPATPTLAPTASPPAPVPVYLNEFLAYPGAGRPEFIELYNAGPGAIDLSGWQLDDLANGGGAPHTIPPGTSIAPGAFWLWTIGGAYLNNGGDAVRLLDHTGRLIDSTQFTNASADRSFSRLPDGAGGWLPDTQPTPLAANQSPAPTSTATPPPPSTATPPPQYRVVLNEFLAAPASGGREFVEVVNLDSRPVDLSAWKIRDQANGTRAFTLTNLLPGGHHALFISSGFLNNGAERVSLLDPLGASTDVVSYTTTTLARSTSRLPDGAGDWSDGTPPTPDQTNQAAPEPAASQIQLNEILPQPLSGGKEYVELINLGAQPVDLSAWQIRDSTGNTRSFTLTSLLPGQIYTLQLATSLLNDTGDDLELLDPGGRVADQYSYQSSRVNRSHSRMPDGAGAWVQNTPPTPGQPNQASPAVIVRLNEFLAAPASGASEYVEVINLGPTEADLAGWTIRDQSNRSQAFTQTRLPPGQRFALHFSSGLLNTADESIALIDPEGLLVDRVAYSSTVDRLSTSRLPDATGPWTLGTPQTPGTANQAPPPAPPLPGQTTIALNEVYARPTSGQREFVEIINRGTSSVDLRGWKLHDGANTTRSFTLTALLPGQIHALAFGSGFLNDTDETLALRDPNGRLVDELSYATSLPELSSSRLPDGTGEWIPGTPPTPDATNQPPPPLPEGVVINEFQPHPPAGEQEWIELTYLGSAPVELGGWLLDDAAGAGSPTRIAVGTLIAPGQFLSIPLTANLLNDGGDEVRLLAPDGTVVDQVSYSTTQASTSWSRLPDGTGAWKGPTPPTPGAPNTAAAGSEPAVDLPSGPAAAPHSVLITEIVYDVPSDRAENSNEWVEIRNATNAPLQLKGWALRDNKAITAIPALEIAAGQLIVLAPTAELISFYPAFTGTLVIVPGAKLGNGLGNSGDQLELLDGSGATIDQVSWGDNTAIFNPAAPDAPVGQSIQRQPDTQDHDTASDWMISSLPNPGSALPASADRSEATAPTGAIPGSLLITQVMYDPPDGQPEPGSEWVEIFNPGTRPITLSGWTLGDSRGQDRLPDLTILAQETLLVAASATLSATLPITERLLVVADHSIGAGLNNSGDRVSLRDGRGTMIDGLSWGSDSSVLNPAAPDVAEGHTLLRVPRHHDTDQAADWRDQPNGQPGRQHAGLPGAAPAAGAGRVVLSEVLAAPDKLDWDGDGAANSKDEWVELFNPGPEPVDIGAWVLDDQPDGGSKPFSIAPGTIITAGGFLVLYGKLTGISLNNSGLEQIRLLQSDGSLADSFEYRTTHKDRSWIRGGDPESAWTGDCRPTPGQANTGCTAVPDPALVQSIAALRDLPLTSTVLISGIVTVAPGVLRKQALYVQDSSGGIQVLLKSKLSWPHLVPGQRITLRGTLALYRNELELKINLLKDLTAGSVGAVPAPIKVSGKGVTAALIGRLVLVNGSYVKAAGSDMLILTPDGTTLRLHPPSSMKKPRLSQGASVVAIGIVGRSNQQLRIQLRSPADLITGRPGGFPATGSQQSLDLRWLILICAILGILLRLWSQRWWQH